MQTNTPTPHQALYMFQQTPRYMNLRELSEDDQQYVNFSISYHKPIDARNSNGRMVLLVES